MDLQVLYGRGESAAALWPVPLVDESQLSDPDDDFCEMEAALNGLLPRGVAYRVGPSTEMVPRKWLQTAVSVRRLKENHPPDILFEELHSMSRLRHPGTRTESTLCFFPLVYRFYQRFSIEDPISILTLKKKHDFSTSIMIFSCNGFTTCSYPRERFAIEFVDIFTISIFGQVFCCCLA